MAKTKTSLTAGDATQNKYSTQTDCDLWEVGEEFSRKPYALAVQEGSSLKNELSTVYVTASRDVTPLHVTSHRVT